MRARSRSRKLAALDAIVAAGAGEWLRGRDALSVLGSGPHLGTAFYGAAKLTEYAVRAHAQCIEEFNHLEMFLADERTLAVVLAPDGASESRAGELLDAWERLGARSVVVGASVPLCGERTARVPLSRVAPHLQPFLLAAALQLLAYRGAVALGRDADRWLGGRRTELILRTSQITVRGSQVDG